MNNLRIFLHIFSASVWVGGQIVMASLVPTLRAVGNDAPKKAAQAFNRVAWPAFGIAVITGMWNLLEMKTLSHPEFEIKFLLVIVSGAGAAIHIIGKSKPALAVGGALAALGGIGAMFMGVLL
jgi:hypothetical protein